MLIEIFCAPVSTEPLWIRKAWIGVKIPVIGNVPKERADASPTGKTLSLRGFGVSSKDAFDALKKTNPKAWDWWFENYGNIITERDEVIAFNCSSCRIIEV